MPAANGPTEQASAETMDPLAAWEALQPDIRQQIGAAAVAAAVGWLGARIAVERDEPDAHRSRDVAHTESLSLIYQLVTINVLEGDDTTLPPRPNLCALGIRQCRSCGCTDDCACEGGCQWVEDDLCSACVPWIEP